ncbi:hypothetical protein H261_12106 [Paramagnetospirillum caucaseum]|uniref:Uncharacterized protein n=1 Tax=Paramagnetospirillum caucaseum TaxID=1244869 RepID=M2ZQR5_9PROT|nr:hypothetical protein [Paramagnetospirillum caucaseum]EME69657.1 hypothetical protein H261_12106 [Paramagnetospirillum caucaseum]
MDPSLREIIAHAVTEARKGGLDAVAQRAAAVTLLAAMIPSLDGGTVQLIVDQLYPFIADLGAAA